MVASGLATPLPAISGAEPCDGSYKPLLFLSSDADGNMPIDPVNMAASSERMSPNMLPVTTTSNAFGALTNCMAALSTYMCDNSTSAYSFDTSIITSRQNCDVSSTLALSTLVSFFARFCAAWNATCAMRRTSGSL